MSKLRIWKPEVIFNASVHSLSTTQGYFTTHRISPKPESIFHLEFSQKIKNSNYRNLDFIAVDFERLRVNTSRDSCRLSQIRNNDFNMWCGLGQSEYQGYFHFGLDEEKINCAFYWHTSIVVYHYLFASSEHYTRDSSVYYNLRHHFPRHIQFLAAIMLDSVYNRLGLFKFVLIG